MNEELRRIINYLIDNGIKSLDWDEEGMDVFRWYIENGKYTIYFKVDYISADNISYALTLFVKHKVIEQLYFSDYIEIDYKARDNLIKLIKHLEIIDV